MQVNAQVVTRQTQKGQKTGAKLIAMENIHRHLLMAQRIHGTIR